MKNNLTRWQILVMIDQRCVLNCGADEDKDHLFVKYDFFGRLWPTILNCLGFSMTFQGKLLDHL